MIYNYVRESLVMFLKKNPGARKPLLDKNKYILDKTLLGNYYLISLYCSLKIMLFEVEINNDDPTEYQ